MTYTEVDGSRRVASLDRELFDEVACRQVAALNEARGGLKERAAKAWLFARVRLGAGTRPRQHVEDEIGAGARG